MRPPLWSSGQSSCLQIQRSGFDSGHYQNFWKVVGLERGPLSLVSTNKELLGRKSIGSGRENRKYGRGDPLHWPRDSLNPQTLALTSSTSGSQMVVRLSALRTRLTLLPRNIIIFMFLVLISVRDWEFITINFRASVRECVDGDRLAQDRIWCRALQVPEKQNFVNNWMTVSFSRRQLSRGICTND
jgi:hypothetical protein